ncbi:hypothetical protein [Nevskia soli]|uniref:hypothetical protein n=1 Tax=Nevskia soli TaxID=418856 RepID=UPI0004A6C1B5|nr:hypothetical protein [Nevskia soli]
MGSYHSRQFQPVTDRSIGVLLQFFFCASYFFVPFWAKSALLILLLTPLLVARLPRLFEAVFLLALAIGLCSYLVFGAAEIKPLPLELSEAVVRTLIAIIFIVPLFFVETNTAAKAIRWLMIGCVIFVFAEGVLTLINAPETAIRRYMMSPQSGEEVHSTGQINSAVLAAGFLLLVSSKKLAGWLGLIGVIFLAVMYLNRTGMLLSATYLCVFFLTTNKMTAKQRWPAFFGVAFLGLILGGPFFDSFMDSVQPAMARLSDEGLESARYEVQWHGLSLLFSGEYPLGGAQLNGVGSTEWYHNLLLDAYRVAGIPTMLIFAFLTAISFHALRKAHSFNLFVIWMVALFIASTSVVLEGFMAEYYTTFAVFSYAFIAGRIRKEEVLVAAERVRRSAQLA